MTLLKQRIESGKQVEIEMARLMFFAGSHEAILRL
jgi:hypothetical protein